MQISTTLINAGQEFRDSFGLSLPSDMDERDTIEFTLHDAIHGLCSLSAAEDMDEVVVSILEDIFNGNKTPFEDTRYREVVCECYFSIAPALRYEIEELYVYMTTL